MGIIGGIPDKRISKGLFLQVLFYFNFIDIIGETRAKRIPEGLFWRFFLFFLI